MKELRAELVRKDTGAVPKRNQEQPQTLNKVQKLLDPIDDLSSLR